MGMGVKVRNNLQLSHRSVGQTQVSRFCIKCLYPLNPLAGPFYSVLSYFKFRG